MPNRPAPVRAPRLRRLAPLMQRLGLGHQLPGLMQVVGLVLGGRFELPEVPDQLLLPGQGDALALAQEAVMTQHQFGRDDAVSQQRALVGAQVQAFRQGFQFISGKVTGH